MTKTSNNLNKNSTSKDILAVFKTSTTASITGWQGQLVSGIIFMIKNKNTKKAFECLKSIIKEYVTKDLKEEWRRVSSQRTKVLSCARRIVMCYNKEIADLDGDQIWQFLKEKGLTNQRAIEKTIDKDGKIRNDKNETETTETETTETETTETETTETEQLVQELAIIYGKFKDKQAFYRAVVSLNPSLFGLQIAKMQAKAA